ncbi:MAG: response regulator, partial [Chloroflexi bacterium]|nr:response regulator [Chloroflexota bacterium]
MKKSPDVTHGRHAGRVLIVDDSKDFAVSLADILESRGYQVEMAYSAQSGREKARSFNPQVALLDIRLGQDSGIDMISQLKGIRPGILCVMMTAYAVVDTAVEAIHRGAHDYLLKPLNVEHLLAVMDRCFERIRLESEKAAADEALRESREFLYRVIDASPNCVFVKNGDGRYLLVNKAQAELYGITPKMLAGKTDRQLVEMALLGAKEAENFTRDDREVINHKQPKFIPEEPFTPLDGVTRWFQTTKVPLTLRGDPNCVLGVAVDITRRKRMEEKMERRNRELALLNRVGQELAATLDLQRVAEQALQQVTETIGAEGASIWLQDEGQEGWLMCQAALSAERHRSLIDLRLHLGQGIAGWVAQTGKSVVTADAPSDSRFFPGIDEQTGFDTTSLLAVPLQVRGAVIGVLEVVNKQKGDFNTGDLALVETLAASTAIAIDNARLVEALRERTAELQARNEELDAYAHTVAHDLKGPLGPIVGFAQVLREDYATLPDEQVRRYLHIIAQNGRKMSSIIDELLLLVGLRDAQVEMSPLDMAYVVREARRRLAYTVKECRAEILSRDAWPVALGYGPWVEEVWVNYLGNALKYGGWPEKGIPPRIELGFDQPAN